MRTHTCPRRYNYACALAALPDRQEEAYQLLGLLLGCGGVAPAELQADPDLSGRPWVAQLVAAATAPGAAPQ